MEVGGRPYNLEMPGFGNVLTDSEVADLLSFVRRGWGGSDEPVSPETVRGIRAANLNRADYWTAEELLKDP